MILPCKSHASITYWTFYTSLLTENQKIRSAPKQLRTKEATPKCKSNKQKFIGNSIPHSSHVPELILTQITNTMWGLTAKKKKKDEQCDAAATSGCFISPPPPIVIADRSRSEGGTRPWIQPENWKIKDEMKRMKERDTLVDECLSRRSHENGEIRERNLVSGNFL